MTLEDFPNWLELWTQLVPGARGSLALVKNYVPAEKCRCGPFGPLRSHPDFGFVHSFHEDGPLDLPWDRLAQMDLLAQESMSYVGGRRDFLQTWFLPYVMQNWQEAMLECPHGTAFLMLISLDVMQDWMGINAAHSFFCGLCGTGCAGAEGPLPPQVLGIG
mmetsp:Transcript_100297/g.323247  ORF Transcript_100297/g.323247 Transcript_100297/m.323247 type:complete len:161 (-) Transcript_100297:1262-1744(-)